MCVRERERGGRKKRAGDQIKIYNCFVCKHWQQLSALRLACLQTAETLGLWFHSFQGHGCHLCCELLQDPAVWVSCVYVYNNKMEIYRIEVLTALLLKITVSWDVALSCWGRSCNVSEDHSLFIFRVKTSVLSWTTWAWRWRWCSSLKCQEPFTWWHRIISSDIGLFLQGVKRTVDEIENRKIYLGELCTAHREENVHLSQAFTTFLEKQNEVSCVCL